MTPKEAIEKRVRHRLEDSFGKALAMLIMAAASNETGVHSFDPSETEYARLIEAICRDQRCVDMWGASGTSDTLHQWRQALNEN